MMAFWAGVLDFLLRTMPWWGVFLSAFALGYVLTPLCRELARRCGMVDKPSARRINKTPIPRAGGLAVFLSVALVMVGTVFCLDAPLSVLLSDAVVCRMLVLSALLVVVGLLDDKFGLPPLVKLAGQVGVALGAHFWCGVGFHAVPFLSGLPMPVDAMLTVFWIVGAVNAFNLIDGLDGLATGLALIAAIGMGGALFFIGYPQATLPYFAFAGACLAFLRYNFHPASVFLGDTGSMFLGFFLSTLPLMTKAGDSFFVSLGVPLLAMGVPIFDTSLAILRRTVRAVLKRQEKGRDEGNTHVMQADTDHLHHRILRKYASQRKAAGSLYGLAFFFVAIGLGGLVLRDRAAGLFILAFVVAVAVIMRDMQRIELWDAGRLLNVVAHEQDTGSRRRRRLLLVPFFVVMDLALLIAVFVVTHLSLGLRIDMHALHTALPIRVVAVFFCIVFFRCYKTIWARAQVSNYIRLGLACFVGTMGGAAVIVLFHYPHGHLMAFSALFFTQSVLALCGLRLVRPIMRDVFYRLDHDRLAENPATRRVVVYGAGLRYAMFRRELVRSSSRNERIVVGLLDDDILLRGLYVGGQRVEGTLHQAKEVLTRLRADTVVIACVLSPERLALARKIFAEAGVKVSLWRCEEEALAEEAPPLNLTIKRERKENGKYFP